MTPFFPNNSERYGSTGLVDDLSMTYDGNRLSHIMDAAERVVLESSLDFDSETGEAYYDYDSDGRLISDTGTGIEHISYAPNDMPVKIESTAGQIRYSYRADGQKVSRSVVTEGRGRLIARNHYYVGPFQFTNNSTFHTIQLERINLPWGYFDSEGAPFVNLTDYQGNIRVVMKGNQVIQQTDYYPYGLPKASAPGSVSRYKYSGKEFETRGGLDLYDFHARLQLPTTGLFSRLDPKAWDAPWNNTYLYCSANPINRIDPDGQYDFENINKDEEYKVVAVFPSNYKKLDEAEGSHALENTYKAAQEVGMPIMLVDNIEDFAAALNDFAESGSSTDIFTLNSHGNDGAFFIGEDMVNALTDVSALKEGLAATNVVIIACRAGANAEGDALLKSFSKQTQSTVIGSNNNIPSRYAYDGGNGLSYKQPLPTPIYGVNKGNDFKMSGVGQRPVTIYNVAIHKTKGLSWDNGFKFRFSNIWNSWKQ